MVLGKFPVPGRPTIWITVGQGPTALAVGAGGGCLDIFILVYPFTPLSPSLWEMARYRLKYCLKGPLNPKQPTNQSGDAKVLGKHSVPGRPATLDNSRARAHCASSMCGWDLFRYYFLSVIFSHLFLPLCTTARYRLKNCLKGPFKPKQPTKTVSKQVAIQLP